MKVSFSLRRIALVVALAMPCLAVPVSAAQAGDFRASGTFAVTSGHGANIEVANIGRASPGGAFTGTFVGKQSPGNAKVHGVTTWDFGGGDTLTFNLAMKPDDATGLLVGTYVITGGTGSLAGASGSGDFIAAPTGDGTGTIELVGTLSH